MEAAMAVVWRCEAQGVAAELSRLGDRWGLGLTGARMSKEPIKHKAQTRKSMNTQDQYEKQLPLLAKAHQLIAAVTMPLSFFALALLVSVAFLVVMLKWGALDVHNRMICICLCVGFSIIVVTIVSIFAWFKPENLMLGIIRNEVRPAPMAFSPHSSRNRILNGPGPNHIRRRALKAFHTTSTGSSKKSKLAREM
jgi:hypothetical protein